MKAHDIQMNSPAPGCSMKPFWKFLEEMGKSSTTGHRWRKAGMITTINIMGKLYVSEHEVEKFMKRAQNGEFARDVRPPLNAKLDSRGGAA